MELLLIRRTETGNHYIIRNSDGRAIGGVIWNMAGANIGREYYSLDSHYKPPKIRKLFRDLWAPRFQMEF